MMWAVESEVVWSCVTLSLSALIAIGYCCIALNWYFQRKMSRTAESKAALARLRGIVLCSGVCGTLLYLTEMPPVLWRIYDAFLAVVAARTWIFLVRMRGLGLVNARLAEANELE